MLFAWSRFATVAVPYIGNVCDPSCGCATYTTMSWLSLLLIFIEYCWSNTTETNEWRKERQM